MSLSGNGTSLSQVSPALTFLGEHEKWQHHAPTIHLLIQADDDFIVFLDAQYMVRFDTADDVEQTDDYDTDALESVFNRVAELEATPCGGFPIEIQKHFKRLIGEGVARALSDKYKLAEKILNSAASYIQARSQETSRFWYLTASIATASAFLFVGAILWIFRAAVNDAVGADAFWIISTAIAGSTGALLSVIGRTGKLHFDSSSGKNLHYLEAASRIFAGALSGALVGAAVMAGIVLDAFVREQNGHLIELLAGFASGASERLATSIITKFGDTKVLQTTD